MPNNALQPTPPRRFAPRGFPRSLRSLGAAERGRWGLIRWQSDLIAFPVFPV